MPMPPFTDEPSCPEQPVLAPRPVVVLTSPAYHGALDYAELEQLGLSPGAVVDFSVNSNPYGPSPAVQQALLDVPLDRYPDREALALRRALAERLEVSPAHLVIGNGTAELLWLAAFAFLRSGDRVLIIGPTFGEYARLAALVGAQVETWPAQAAADFAVSFDAVAGRLQTFRPRLVFVCNPNNPTGVLLPPETIAGWAQAQPQTLFIVDEAYLAFVPQACSALSLRMDNVLIMRSMTKDYALAGLRLGYAASANQMMIEALARVRPAWNVNALAQAAGLAALADEAYRQQTLAALAHHTRSLVAGLGRLGLSPVPSATHYFLLDVGQAAAFRLALLRQGLLVRDCASFDLPAYVRIAARRPADNDRLLSAIESLGASARPGKP
jgi:histidinol-phosphate aminotransferase